MASNSSRNNVTPSENEADEILEMISKMPELASMEKGVLDEKYRLVMAIFKEDLKTKRFIEMRKKIETLHDQQKADNEKIKGNIKMIHDKEEQIRSSLAKTLDYRKNIDDRIDSLMNFMTSSIEPKMQHSLRCLASLTKKINALDDDRALVKKRHDDLMATKALKSEKLEEDMAEAIEMEEEAAKKIFKFDAETASEAIKIDTARKSLNEVNVLRGLISTVEKSIGEAELDIATIKSEMKDKKREAVEIENKISSTESLVEQLNIKCEAELTKVDLYKRTLQDLGNMVEVIIQQRSSFEALESNEIFKREAMNRASYTKKREKLHHEITAGIALADDLQRLEVQDEMLMEEKKEALMQLGEVQQIHGSLEAQAKEIDQLESADQLQARIDDTLKAREIIKKEIGDLKKILEKDQEAHEKEAGQHDEELSSLSLKLQAEEKKTKEAQDSQVMNDIASVASSTSQKSLSDRRATLQPRPWTQPYAEIRAESRRSMTFTPSPSTSRFAELMAEKKKLSPPVSTPESKFRSHDEVKTAVKKEEEDKDDAAFSDGDTDEMNFTFNTDLSELLK